MKINIRCGTKGLNWEEVCKIFKLAPLGTRNPEELKKASEQSYTVCTAWHSETMVGFGRAISDGQYQSVIYDIVVLPEYQGKGIGTSITQKLLEEQPDSSTVLLYAVPGKEGFYRKLGFGDLTTGMGVFPDQEIARSSGYLK
ncbi:MAG: GNAT family N-acetyltransferase [Bacteroidota bacterium]